MDAIMSYLLLIRIMLLVQTTADQLLMFQKIHVLLVQLWPKWTNFLSIGPSSLANAQQFHWDIIKNSWVTQGRLSGVAGSDRWFQWCYTMLYLEVQPLI